MRRLLRASDVYVSTSKMDAGLATSTAEAMAIGLSVAQTDNSDNAYWTPNGEGGLLVPNGDPVALADAVICLLGDVALSRGMGERNRQMVIKEYNIDTEMSRIESQYIRLSGKS
jgi:glycosyltransferase involved in cell wall biosynthesis